MNIAYDLDDLKQEARIIVWRIFTKYRGKPIGEIKKIICKAVGHRLYRICGNSQKQTKIDFIDCNKEEPQIILGEILENEFGNYEDYENIFTTKPFRDDTLPENMLIQPAVMDNLFLEELKALCNKKEVKDFLSKLDIHYRIKETLFELLYNKYVLDYTYEAIGIEFGLTRQRTEQIFKQILQYLKKYF
jgi:hypothetical protein